MQKSGGPSARVGLRNLLCPRGKIRSCLVSHVEEPGPRSQKISNYLPVVDTEKGQGRYMADQDGAGGGGFPSFVLASCKASLGLEKTTAARNTTQLSRTGQISQSLLRRENETQPQNPGVLPE